MLQAVKDAQHAATTAETPADIAQRAARAQRPPARFYQKWPYQYPANDRAKKATSKKLSRVASSFESMLMALKQTPDITNNMIPRIRGESAFQRATPALLTARNKLTT